MIRLILFHFERGGESGYKEKTHLRGGNDEKEMPRRNCNYMNASFCWQGYFYRSLLRKTVFLRKTLAGLLKPLHFIKEKGEKMSALQEKRVILGAALLALLLGGCAYDFSHQHGKDQPASPVTQDGTSLQKPASSAVTVVPAKFISNTSWK